MIFIENMMKNLSNTGIGPEGLRSISNWIILNPAKVSDEEKRRQALAVLTLLGQRSAEPEIKQLLSKHFPALSPEEIENQVLLMQEYLVTIYNGL